jgi:hypothetical protein
MGLSRLGVVMLLAFAMVGAWGAFTFGNAFGAGSSGPSHQVTLLQGNGHGGGNGNGNGNGNGHNKDKNKGEQTDADQEDADATGGFCGDMDAMLQYLEGKNNNGAAHANGNGADNAAAGRLNSCMEHHPNGESAQGEGDTKGDVTVNVDVDEDGNGKIEYDLDGDCKVDFTVVVGEGPEGTPEASPEATPDAEASPTGDEELMDNCEVDDDESADDSSDSGDDSENATDDSGEETEAGS